MERKNEGHGCGNRRGSRGRRATTSGAGWLLGACERWHVVVIPLLREDTEPHAMLKGVVDGIVSDCKWYRGEIRLHFLTKNHSFVEIHNPLTFDAIDTRVRVNGCNLTRYPRRALLVTVLLKALLYASASSSQLSTQGKKLLSDARENYAKILLGQVQRMHGTTEGAARYVDLLSLVDTCFHFGQKYKEHLYMLFFLSPKVFPGFQLINDVLGG
ncbi:CRE-NHR-36 protein [Aphelenchoides avenae]|nr:CRE-NHR-36 protein [Aphelenchus avenae]